MLVPGGGLVWKTDEPRAGHAGRTCPIAAAVEQATDAAKCISQGDARGENVGDFQKRQFFPADIDEQGDGRADEAAIVNQSAMLDHENFRNRLMGEFAPVGRHVHDTGAHHPGNHDPEYQVGNFFAGDVFCGGARLAMAVQSPVRKATAIITPYQWIVNEPN